MLLVLLRDADNLVAAAERENLANRCKNHTSIEDDVKRLDAQERLGGLRCPGAEIGIVESWG